MQLLQSYYSYYLRVQEKATKPQSYYHAATEASSSDSLSGLFTPSLLMPAQPASSTTVQSVTPEMIQQMILQAFSTLSISGKNQSSSSIWYFNFEDSNHMTFAPTHLPNVKTYDRKLQVHAADGGRLPITAIGDASHSLPLHNVFLSPDLSTNLLSI